MMNKQLELCFEPQENLASAEEIICQIKSMLGEEYLDGVGISLKNNLSSYDSIVINSPATAYRDTFATDCLFARLNLKGKNPYIAFGAKWKNEFEQIVDIAPPSKSEKDFLRIPIAQFQSLCHNAPLPVARVLKQVYLDVFNFTPFGCCGKYLECSNAKHCVHVDKVYSTSCQYRKSLETGNIFYGKNRTTPQPL